MAFLLAAFNLYLAYGYIVNLQIIFPLLFSVLSRILPFIFLVQGMLFTFLGIFYILKAGRVPRDDNRE